MLQTQPTSPTSPPATSPTGPEVRGYVDPDFKVVINGSPLPATVEPYIMALVVDCDQKLPSMFALELAGADTLAGDASWVDDASLFSIGYGVEIKLGYGDKLTTVITGEITSLEPEFSADRNPRLMVRGYDRRHRLQRGRKTRTFVQLKDSDIATQLAKEAGLTAQVTDSQVVQDYVLQANQTDLKFLQERARRLHYEVVAQDKTLLFRPVAHTSSAVISLTFENDLLEFSPCLSSFDQVSEVVVQGWDVKQKQAIEARAQVGDEGSQMGGQTTGAALVEQQFGPAIGSVSTYPVVTQAEADQLAKARFNQVALDLITGEGLCQGRTDLQAGTVINLKGIGQRFSGDYYLTSVIHRYSPHRGYQTQFTVRRTAS